MKNIKSILFGLVALSIVALIIGCNAEPNAANLGGETKLIATLEDENAKTLYPEGYTQEDGKTVKWLLRGEGPNGAKFPDTRTSGGAATKQSVSDPNASNASKEFYALGAKTFKISGIKQGNWSLFAVALNGKGDRIVAAKVENTYLSGVETVKSITLEKLVGTGNENIIINYPNNQITNDKNKVKLEINYKKQGTSTFIPADSKNFKFKTDTIISDNIQNIWSGQELDAGSYIVQILLKENISKPETPNWVVQAGTADAMRIIDNKITKGNITLTIGKIDTEYDITFDDRTGTPLDGQIIASTPFTKTSVKGVVDWYPTVESFDGLVDRGIVTCATWSTIKTGLAGKPNISTSAEAVTALKSAFTAKKITCEWFVNGLEIKDVVYNATAGTKNTADVSNDNTATFFMPAGDNHLTCVINSELLGSTGSSSLEVQTSL